MDYNKSNISLNRFIMVNNFVMRVSCKRPSLQTLNTCDNKRLSAGYKMALPSYFIEYLKTDYNGDKQSFHYSSDIYWHL